MDQLRRGAGLQHPAAELHLRAGQGLLDELYAANKQQLYTAVGYGLEGAGPKTAFGGDTRRRVSNNAATGGTSFGDSGGPATERGAAAGD